jgi:peptidoglycan/xylan/chitin deacetylase (PgdA/CDA1 family)
MPERRSRATALTGLAVGAVALVLIAAGGGRSGNTGTRLDPLPAPLHFPFSVEHREREAGAIDRVLRYTPYIAVGSARRRDVALTFDDGPGPYTAAILRVLRREHAPATFFVVGRQVALYPSLVKLEEQEGFVVGDHTQNHPSLGSLRPKVQRAEIFGDAQAIASAGAPWPRLFRPPYGSFDGHTLSLLRRGRMLMTLWSVDTRDFARPGVRAIVAAAAAGARPGAILLLHDAGGERSQTIAALPKIVHLLRRRHLHLVTLPRLILDDPPPRDQPKPRSLSRG